MQRTIEAVGDRESALIVQLKSECHSIERKAEREFHLHFPLYSAILFAPSLEDNALGIFIADSKVIVLSDELAGNDVPFSYIKNIFLHELAHALETAVYKVPSGHGEHFHRCCRFLGVENGFDRAKIKKKLEDRAHRKEKIEKLMALTASSFEEEAETALRMAKRLMAETASEDSINKESERIYTAILDESARISSGSSYLLNLTEKSTGVFLVRSRENNKSAVRAYGEIEEVELAIYLYDYLKSAIDSEIARLRRSGQKISRNNFIYGAYIRLKDSLSGNSTSDSKAIVMLNQKNRRLAEKLVFKNVSLRSKRIYSNSYDPASIQLGGNFASDLKMPDRISQKKLQ